MNILQLNIRASQGGAGRVCLDLHRRLNALGVNSRLLYGYASGISDDDQVADDLTVERIGGKISVIANFASHVLTGRDRYIGRTKRLSAAIAEADLVHVHVPHHYYIDWYGLLNCIERHRKPVLYTAHDWWLVTGRCGFVRDCGGWRRACGECGRQRFEDLYSLVDFSAAQRQRKIDSVRAMASQFMIVCPSHHLARDHRAVFPNLRIDVVENGLDVAFEKGVASYWCNAERRSGAIFSASDLSAPGKVDHGLVKRAALGPGYPLKFVGRNDPFAGYPGEHLGEVRGRGQMAKLLCEAEVLVFCSQMDNAPLTIIEALMAGCYVVAYRSPAAEEIIGALGGRCVSGLDEAQAVLAERSAAALYQEQPREAIARRAAALFSGETMARDYIRLYRSCIEDRDAGAMSANAVAVHAPDTV